MLARIVIADAAIDGVFVKVKALRLIASMEHSAAGICHLDHATTAGVCSADVRNAMMEVLDGIRSSPGRSSHRFARYADERMERARGTVAAFFDVPITGVVFCPGATHALNLAIKGVLKAGDHVIATCFEHNSVLRPLKRLDAEGCRVTFITPMPGESFADTLEREIRPETRLVVLSHASNVTGELLPVVEMAGRARSRGALVLVDAAQSAGHVPVNLPSLSADMVVISGHKGLLGPPDIGCLLLSDPHLPITPLIDGGTGIESESLTPRQFVPYSLEAGTQNLPAVAGLEAAICFASTAEFQDGGTRLRPVVVKPSVNCCAKRMGSACLGPLRHVVWFPWFRLLSVALQWIALARDSTLSMGSSFGRASIVRR